jgi:hypothetical protein
MEETSDGTTVMKCKLSTIVQDDKLLEIINPCVKKLSKLVYKAYDLFRLYIFHCVKHKIKPVITQSQLDRCMNLVKKGSCKLRSGKNAPEVKILHKILRENNDLFERMPTPDFKSANNPLNYARIEILTNISVQISEHYERYQRRYLRQRVKSSLPYGLRNLTYGQICALAYEVQKVLNKDQQTLAEFTSTHFPDSEVIEELLPHLNKLIKVVRNEIPKSIRKINVTTLKCKANYGTFVIYMHQMAQYLQKHKQPSFSPLPNLKLKRRHFLFSKIFLCSVYNQWKNSKIGIKDFEANYERYYRQMFKTHDIYRNLCERYEFPKSYVTNGYTVSIIFSPKPKAIVTSKKGRVKSSRSSKSKGKKEPSIPIDHPEDGRLEPGLYDADNLNCSKKQLEQYHFTAIDPGNSKMFNCITYDTKKKDYGESFVINKGYYNEISHITRNTRKRAKITDANKVVSKCYSYLSLGRLKGGRVEDYLTYMKTIVNNWDALWKNAMDERLPALSYDTYLHSKMAVAKICRQIREHNPTSKPAMYIIGKGNGRMTINNTKNSSSHGPIKRIVHALSLLAPVVLTDENKTSKLCNDCTSPLVFPKMHFRKKLRKLIKERFGLSNLTKKEYDKYAPRVVKYQIATKYEGYKACYCSEYEHTNKSGKLRNIIWQRDTNSGRCIFRVAIGKMTGEPLEAFSRPPTAEGR